MISNDLHFAGQSDGICTVMSHIHLTWPEHLVDGISYIFNLLCLFKVIPLHEVSFEKNVLFPTCSGTRVITLSLLIFATEIILTSKREDLLSVRPSATFASSAFKPPYLMPEAPKPFRARRALKRQAARRA